MKWTDFDDGTTDDCGYPVSTRIKKKSYRWDDPGTPSHRMVKKLVEIFGDE